MVNDPPIEPVQDETSVENDDGGQHSNMYDHEGPTLKTVQESCQKNTIFYLWKEKEVEITNIGLKLLGSEKYI